MEAWRMTRRYDNGVIVGESDVQPTLVDWVRGELEHAKDVYGPVDCPKTDRPSYLWGRITALKEVQRRLEY
jgi:hypothetical protein